MKLYGVKKPSYIIVVLGMLVVILEACTPTTTVLGAGARTGLALAEDRPVKEIWEDSRLKIAINQELLTTSFKDTYWSLNTTIFEGRVLITGRVKTSELRDQVNQIVWAVTGVRQVINEIEVSQETNLTQIARDQLIQTSLQAKMLSDPMIADINYKIVAHNGSLYVIGVAQDKSEVDQVVQHARTVPYVKRFVHYVQLATDPSRLR